MIAKEQTAALQLTEVGAGMGVRESGPVPYVQYSVADTAAALFTWQGQAYRAHSIIVYADGSEPWIFFVKRTRSGHDYRSGVGVHLTIADSLRHGGADSAANTMADLIEAAIMDTTITDNPVTPRQTQLADALVTAHADAHSLLAEVARMVDDVDPDTADWGHVGNLRRIVECLRNAAGLDNR